MQRPRRLLAFTALGIAVFAGGSATAPNAAEAARRARTPQGEWAERIPPIEVYAASIPAAHAAALANFRQRFPDLDPSDVQNFAEATMRQRASYGAELDEQESADFTRWLVPLEEMQSAVVVARAALVGITLSGTEPAPAGDSRAFSLAGFDGVSPVYSFTQNAATAISTNVHRVRMSTAFDFPLSSSVSDVTRNASGAYVSGGNISGFSSRGPAFDGRIKPDFCANGEGVTSPLSPTGSSSKQGTSMATPNASRRFLRLRIETAP